MYYAVIIIGNPENPILIVKAPIVGEGAESIGHAEPVSHWIELRQLPGLEQLERIAAQ